MNKDENYYLSLDRRTREYKEWKAKYDKSSGVGDKIEKLTKLTGIQAVVKRLFGENCGCDERQEKINTMFGRPVNPLTEEEYIFLDSVINSNEKIKPKQQIRLKEIYERVFNKKVIASCFSCSFRSQIFRPLTRVFNEYK